MAILQAQCDDCGHTGPPEEVYEDYNGTCRCERCHLLDELKRAQQDLNEKIEWCHKCHIHPAKAKVEELKAQIAHLTTP